MKEQSGCRSGRVGVKGQERWKWWEEKEKGEGRKAGKMKGSRAGGWEMNGKAGGSDCARWRVPELTPKTPGPVASADIPQHPIHMIMAPTSELRV